MYPIRKFASSIRNSRRRLLLETLEIRNLMASDLDRCGRLDTFQPVSELVAEGEADVRAALSYEFYAVNADGTLGRNLDPNPTDSVFEAEVGRGEEFVVRTLVQDVRTNPKGVFSTYADLRYANRDGSTTEKMQVQWSDRNQLKISKQGKEGSFRLQYGSDVSEPIELVFDGSSLNAAETASRIAQRIELLPTIGVDNVLVEPSLVFRADDPNQSDYVFEISFRNGKARRDIVAPSVVDNQLLPLGGSAPVSITISDIADATSSSDKVLLGAMDFAPPVSQDYLFFNGRSGVYLDVDQTNSATRILARAGGFSSSNNLPSRPGLVMASHDTRFFASETGIIDLQYGLATNSNGTNLGISLFSDSSQYLTALQVGFSSAVVRIEDPIQAVSDFYEVDIASSGVDLNVLANDTSRFPIDTVSLVSLPSRGSVTILPDGKTIRYVPDPSSMDPVGFVYRVHDSQGNTDEATVQLVFVDLTEDPTLDPIDDVTMKYNPAEMFIALSGISAGGSESQPLQIFTYSSNTNIVPFPEVFYQSPNSAGLLRLKPNRWASGTAEVTVFVEDGGRDGDLSTLVDNKIFSRSFTVTVADPTTSHFNPRNRFDVDDDGVISPLDLLTTINLQNALGPSIPVSSLNAAPPYHDVDSDSLVSPIDTLQIVDFLNDDGSGGGGGSGGSNSEKAELSYTITDINGNVIDSAVVGTEWFVNIFVKDLRSSGNRGVWSSYSNLLVVNGDATTAERVRFVSSTASSDFPNGALQGDWVDLGGPDGAKLLKNVGGFSNRYSHDDASKRLVSRSRFVAVREGSVEIGLNSADPNDRFLGHALLSDSSDYLDSAQIRLPSVSSFEILTDIEAIDDQYTLTEDSGVTTLAVLGNDRLPLSGDTPIIQVSQPKNGAVVISEDRKTVRYTPEVDFFGSVSFTYTLKNERGVTSTATVNVNVTPVNDPPTIDSVSDFSVPEDIGVFELSLTGITAGPGESEPLQVTATSSRPEVISIDSIDYTSPNTTGKVRLKVGLVSSGSSVIEVEVRDAGVVGLRATMRVTISLTPRSLDFGDAPWSEQTGFAKSYPTLLVDDGARHLRGVLHLGQTVDGEADGQPQVQALGDDQRRWDDEDGVSFPLSIIGASSIQLRNTFIARASAPGFVDAFIDFNRDGDWDDPGERIADAHPVTAGRNLIPFNVPTGIGNGVSFARIRLSSAGGLNPTGLAGDGEVEDHAVLLIGLPPAKGRLNMTQLGSHAIGVAANQISVSAEGIIVWQAPTSLIESLVIHDDEDNVISELKNFTEEMPGTLEVDDSTGEIELTVTLPSVTLTDNSSLGKINTIDLVSSDSNQLSFQPSDVAKLNEEKTLLVMMGATDTLNTGSQWIAGAGKEVDGRYVQTYTAGEVVLEVMSERPWRNEVSPLDVDGNRGVDPLDVLVLVNTINLAVFQSGQLPNRINADVQAFLDSNGDNNLGPLDVLIVINHLNRSQGNGEGEGGARSVPNQATDRLFAQWAYSPDVEDWHPNRGRSRWHLLKLDGGSTASG
jgi:hypothetical protein